MADQPAFQGRIQSFRTAPEAGAYVRSTGNGHRSHERGELRQYPARTHDREGATGHTDPHQASTGQLVSQAASQISTLVRSELALGRAELMEKGKRLGLGSGLLATAGLLGFFALGLLVTLFVVILDRDWPLWLAVLVPLLTIGALCLLLAGIGVSKLRSGAQAPTEAAHSVRDDIRSMKQAFQDGRHWR